MGYFNYSSKPISIDMKTFKIFTVFSCFILMAIACFPSCSLDYDTTIKINGEIYDIANPEWTPYGNTRTNGTYYLYGNNSGIIFAKGTDDIFFDSLIYHNRNDSYPDISMVDKIAKIILDTEASEITVSEEFTEMLLQEFNNTDKVFEPADFSTAEVFVNVYYKDYPAFQNEYVLCLSDNGKLGYMYCDTEKNTESFGNNNMSLFSNNELKSYISSLDLF